MKETNPSFILLTIVCVTTKACRTVKSMQSNKSRKHFTDGSVFLSVDLKDRSTKGFAACCLKTRPYITMTTKIYFKIG